MSAIPVVISYSMSSPPWKQASISVRWFYPVIPSTNPAMKSGIAMAVMSTLASILFVVFGNKKEISYLIIII